MATVVKAETRFLVFTEILKGDNTFLSKVGEYENKQEAIDAATPAVRSSLFDGSDEYFILPVTAIRESYVSEDEQEND